MFKEDNVPSQTNARSSNQTSSPKTVLCRLAIAAMAVLTICQSTGCSGHRLAVKDAVLVSYRDAVWARRAFNLRYGNCNRPYSTHFESGFCAGYADICGGGDGYVPAMPPSDYRSYEFQCAEGAQCVNAWFEGYPAGVAAARKDKVGNYNDVLISRMINSAVAQKEAKHILPSDVPVVGSNKSSPAGAPVGQMSPAPRLPQPSFVAPPAPKLSAVSSTEMMQMQMATAPTIHVPAPQPEMPTLSQPSYTVPTEASVPQLATNEIPIISREEADSQRVTQVRTAEMTQPTLPPIVTGSGVAAPQNNMPLPMTVKPAQYESTRRTR